MSYFVELLEPALTRVLDVGAELDLAILAVEGCCDLRPYLAHLRPQVLGQAVEIQI